MGGCAPPTASFCEEWACNSLDRGKAVCSVAVHCNWNERHTSSINRRCPAQVYFRLVLLLLNIQISTLPTPLIDSAISVALWTRCTFSRSLCRLYATVYKFHCEYAMQVTYLFVLHQMSTTSADIIVGDQPLSICFSGNLLYHFSKHFLTFSFS